MLLAWPCLHIAEHGSCPAEQWGVPHGEGVAVASAAEMAEIKRRTHQSLQVKVDNGLCRSLRARVSGLQACQISMFAGRCGCEAMKLIRSVVMGAASSPP